MRRTLGLAGAALFAAACASTPDPAGEIANADLALRKAEAVNAAEVAPLEARLAREKLEDAKLAEKSDNYARAKRLAEQAEVDAVVAEAKARSVRADQELAQLRKEVGQLGGASGATSSETTTEIIIDE